MSLIPATLFTIAGIAAIGTIAIEIRRALQPGSAVRMLLGMKE